MLGMINNKPQNKIHRSSKIYGDSLVGADSIILENVILGYPSGDVLKEIIARGIEIEEHKFKGVKIGEKALIRANSVIYCDVETGNKLKTGHHVLVREKSKIGHNVLIGTNVIIDGAVTIGNNVSIQSGAYLPPNTVIEDNVFIGPRVVFTNDKYPIRKEYGLKGAKVRKGASIGANAVILPDVEISEGAMVAAGSVVTKDVPPWSLAIGVPAKIIELPADLRTINKI